MLLKTNSNAKINIQLGNTDIIVDQHKMQKQAQNFTRKDIYEKQSLKN